MSPGRLETPRVVAVRTILPVLFAVAVVVGMVLTAGSVIATPDVDIGAWRSIGHDALSLYLGHGLYHNPAGNGYNALIYTPLLPVLLAGLDQFDLWNGWPVLVCVLATAALALMIAWLAGRAAGDARASTRAGAVGMGGAAVWLTTTAVGFLYFGWTDELAWAFALAGLIAGAQADRSRLAGAATVALLTLAFWTKQSTFAASAGFAAWLVVLTIRGHRSIRSTATLLGALAAANLVVLGTFALATGGWGFYLDFIVPSRFARIYGLRTGAGEVVTAVGLPALWALALCLAATGRDWRQAARLDSTGGLLAVFVAVGIPFAIYFRTAQGSNPNEFFGVIWALGAIAALAWGWSRRGGHSLRVDALVALALLGAATATANRAGRFDLRRLRIDYSLSIPADLRALASRGGLFHPAYTDLNPGQVYQDASNIVSELAGDAQPMGLVRALIDRPFRYAVTYRTALGPAGYALFNVFGSAYGKYEANFFWKLDQVIESGYGPGRGLPAGVLERRTVPEDTGLQHCFAPFHLAAATWVIRRGGGFWCTVAPGTITLSRSPAPLSELVTQNAVTVHGKLAVAARVGARVFVDGMEAERLPGGWAVVTRRGTDRVRGSTLHLPIDVPTATRLSVLATPARGVTLDLSRLRLEQ